MQANILNLLSFFKKNVPEDGQTLQTNSSSKPANFAGANQALMKPLSHWLYINRLVRNIPFYTLVFQ